MKGKSTLHFPLYPGAIVWLLAIFATSAWPGLWHQKDPDYIQINSRPVGHVISVHTPLVTSNGLGYEDPGNPPESPVQYLISGYAAVMYHLSNTDIRESLFSCEADAHSVAHQWDNLNLSNCFVYDHDGGPKGSPVWLESVGPPSFVQTSTKKHAMWILHHNNVGDPGDPGDGVSYKRAGLAEEGNWINYHQINTPTEDDVIPYATIDGDYDKVYIGYVVHNIAVDTYQVNFYYSTDEGSQFVAANSPIGYANNTQPIAYPTVASATCLGTHYVYLFWQQADGTATSLYYAQSTNYGQDWSTPEEIVHSVADGAMSAGVR